MAELKNHLDLYKLLPKTNCRDCGLAACLAFAATVMAGTKKLSACPHLAEEVLKEYGGSVGGQSRGDDGFTDDAMKQLTDKIKALDLAQAAVRTGGIYADGHLTIQCLGKPFTVDDEGALASGCHVNPWVLGPILNYVIRCAGKEPVGRWVSMRDLPGGEDWARFFEHRCEAAFKKVVDNYTGLFEHIIAVFGGKRAPEAFDSDIAVVVHPLPKVPVLICYWKPEDGMGSSLNLFFDITAADNLGAEALYVICTGMTVMFEKISQTHGR